MGRFNSSYFNIRRCNIDFGEDNPFVPEDQISISPKFVISTQNNWLGGWVFVTNIIVDRVTTEYPSYGYIITLTHALNQNFSILFKTNDLRTISFPDKLLRVGAQP